MALSPGFIPPPALRRELKPPENTNALVSTFSGGARASIAHPGVTSWTSRDRSFASAVQRLVLR